MSIANSSRRHAAGQYARITIAPQKARQSLFEVARINCLLLLIWTFWFPDPVSIGTVNLNIVPVVLLILLTLVAGRYNDGLGSPRDTFRVSVMVGSACLLAALAAISMSWVDI